MEVADVEEVGVLFVGVVEAVVGVGEALVVSHHEVGAVVVVSFADLFEAGVGFPVFGEGEGFKAIRGSLT